MSAPLPPSLQFAFEARVACDPPLRIGRGEHEEVWFTPITGGTVAGPRLQGTVLPHGGDWSVTRANGTELDARYLLQTDAPQHEWLTRTVVVGLARPEPGSSASSSTSSPDPLRAGGTAAHAGPVRTYDSRERT